MKNIYFLRHAKSSWNDFRLKDFDRPLATRGIQDADLMGNYFLSKKIKLDLIISSPSRRTKETIDHFFLKTRQNIVYEEKIYHCGIEEILSELYGLDESIKSVMVVGHNPSMHEITEHLTGKYLEKYPTCGLAALSYIDIWTELKERSADLEFFLKPSQLR